MNKSRLSRPVFFNGQEVDAALMNGFVDWIQQSLDDITALRDEVEAAKETTVTAQATTIRAMALGGVDSGQP